MVKLLGNLLARSVASPHIFGGNQESTPVFNPDQIPSVVQWVLDETEYQNSLVNGIPVLESLLPHNNFPVAVNRPILSFDGSNDYAHAPISGYSYPFSISAWVLQLPIFNIGVGTDNIDKFGCSCISGSE